jgi:hypothetical protein
MTLKDMKKLAFSDWSTLFANPADFSSNVTSVGIWTKEITHLKDIRYPDKMGILKPLSVDTLENLSNIAHNATKELYVEYSRWPLIKRLMLGTSIYSNLVMALFAGYAGIENDFNWTWARDYALDNPFKTDILEREKIKFYIDKLKRWNGVHPFLKRFFRRIRVQKADPFYYYLQD